MLNREHLRLHRRGDRALPVFTDTSSPAMLSAAENVLAVFRACAAGRCTRGELAEQLETIQDPKHETAALIKLAEDVSSFSSAAEMDYPALRARLFAAGGTALYHAETPEELRKKLAETTGLTDFLQTDIYGDLPENQQMTAFRDMTARELLERYNTAQVQGLLLNARQMTVHAGEPDPAALRRLFKYLKFFRLLAEINHTDKGYELKISGPLAIFANTRKYAVQLAAFFPAVLQLPRWRMSAEIEWKNKILQLKLDETTRLRSHYKNFSAYVPEEITMFHRLFKDKIRDWVIAGETPVISGPGGEAFFPDLSFRETETGRVIHLELFHRWHKTQLENRLRFLAGYERMPLLLGIDRSIANEDTITQYLVQWPGLAGKVFLFRDFPGVDRVAKMLREM